MKLLILFFLMAVLAGCTVVNFDQATDSEAHVTVMPATQTAVMSAADGQWSDRAQRAAGDAQESGDTSAQQTATAVPTVSIPLTGASPADAASRVDEYLHSGEALLDTPEAEPEQPETSTEEVNDGD